MIALVAHWHNEHIFDLMSICSNNKLTNFTNCFSYTLPKCLKMSHLIKPKCNIPFLCNVNKCFLNVTIYSLNVTIFEQPKSTMDILVTIQISSQIFFFEFSILTSI